MISIIAAVADNNVVWVNNKLPWDLPEDLKHFQVTTKGKPVLMGDRTFESIVSILGKPLPGRKNIVVTLNKDFKVPEGVELSFDLFGVLEKYKNEDLFVIGGPTIWKLSLSKVDRLYITHVHKSPQGDAFFPEVNWSEWKKVSSDPREGIEFAVYDRL
jgi:dihydrofolate reductase